MVSKRKLLDFRNVWPTMLLLSSSSQNFSLQDNQMTIKLSVGWIQLNSKLVSWPNTEHIKLKTIASMPLLWFCWSKNRSCSIKLIRCTDVVDIVDVKFFIDFFVARKGNDHQTVVGNNSTKFKTPVVGEHTKYLTLNG